MLVCSNPIFAIFEHSKAARFVSVPLLPTVAYCECKETECITYCNTKRPEIWPDKLKKQLEKVESSFVHCALYVKVTYFELRSKTHRIIHLTHFRIDFKEFFTIEFRNATSALQIAFRWHVASVNEMLCRGHVILKSETVKKKKNFIPLCKGCRTTSLAMWKLLLQRYSSKILRSADVTDLPGDRPR